MRSRSGRGFTLTEVMVATSVIGFAVLGFGTLFPAATQSMARSRHRDLAAQSANGELEYWRGVGYHSIHTILLPGINSKTLPLVTPLPSRLSDATGQVVIARANDDFTDLSGETADTGRVRVTVSITWKENTGPTGSVSITTIVPDHSIEDAADQDEPDEMDEDDADYPDTDDDKESNDVDPEEDDENLDLTLPMPSLPTR